MSSSRGRQRSPERRSYSGHYLNRPKVNAIGAYLGRARAPAACSPIDGGPPRPRDDRRTAPRRGRDSTPEHDPHQRRLTRPVRPQQPREHPRRNLQTHPVKSQPVTERVRDVVNLEPHGPTVAITTPPPARVCCASPGSRPQACPDCSSGVARRTTMHVQAPM